ncbi:MAG: hypothetical protein HRU20_30140 [Pseudomonadales bacterium]|nr:hypothetical protein [Pseudomonadales bacterium]
MFFVLFVFFAVVLRPTQGYFTHTETSPIADEGLQILTFTQHLWPLSSAGQSIELETTSALYFKSTANNQKFSVIEML